jgi:hypothetical protein
MGSLVITRSPRGDVPSTPPRRPDGTAYRFELIYDGAKHRAYADDLVELMGALIPGYESLDGPSRAVERLVAAVRAQVRLQAWLCAEGDLEACSAEEREILLGSRHQPPAVERWEALIPLVLVENYYEPQGGLPRPEGVPQWGGGPDSNLIWIDASSEMALFLSLHLAGDLRLASSAG